jgi:hypothetical protein
MDHRPHFGQSLRNLFSWFLSNQIWRLPKYVFNHWRDEIADIQHAHLDVLAVPCKMVPTLLPLVRPVLLLSYSHPQILHDAYLLKHVKRVNIGIHQLPLVQGTPSSSLSYGR